MTKFLVIITLLSATLFAGELNRDLLEKELRRHDVVFLARVETRPEYHLVPEKLLIGRLEDAEEYHFTLGKSSPQFQSDGIMVLVSVGRDSDSSKYSFSKISKKDEVIVTIEGKSRLVPLSVILGFFGEKEKHIKEEKKKKSVR